MAEITQKMCVTLFPLRSLKKKKITSLYLLGYCYSVSVTDIKTFLDTG